MLHCFSGDATLAQDLAAGGYLISFALPVTFSSARGPRAAAAALADGTFLVETDSPWLAPGGGEQRNEPTTALRVAAELARLRGTSPEAIAATTGGSVSAPGWSIAWPTAASLTAPAPGRYSSFSTLSG